MLSTSQMIMLLTDLLPVYAAAAVCVPLSCCRDVFGVQQMAYAVDKSQMIMLRNNMVSKCGMPDFEVGSLAIGFYCFAMLCTALLLDCTALYCTVLLM